MGHEIPWASCFATKTLVLYLERIGKDTAVDYHEVLSDIGSQDRIEDPKAFLKDYNNWVPLHVLRNLIRISEKVTGNKEVAPILPPGIIFNRVTDLPF